MQPSILPSDWADWLADNHVFIVADNAEACQTLQVDGELASGWRIAT